ncbi:hypothetical protein ASPZODRAFT_137592 [Penicilliopsis zonata CBS 506.65]|uniref:Uncharacterized protein n=1 Tax=Penicilliopsis zonata CBS 506.65 TaxID=1073090 RepID=A0A1L9S493_9EURO|nr:hypothetical protein ASPZODRAFT_137592 [Penicilliopsis zonata CBS 506.65]OJJ41990.1 hypothetical protein ASPZODRAFT_137592 [Penicilliopsis zonata CBS 506.65]
MRLGCGLSQPRRDRQRQTETDRQRHRERERDRERERKREQQAEQTERNRPDGQSGWPPNDDRSCGHWSLLLGTASKRRVERFRWATAGGSPTKKLGKEGRQDRQ